MVNENYEPTENDELVLDAFKQGRDDGKPWGRPNRVWISEQTDLDKRNAEFSLRSLNDAGWIQRVARGLYELVEDPREADDTE
jgi:hypothetical protein